MYQKSILNNKSTYLKFHIKWNLNIKNIWKNVKGLLHCAFDSKFRNGFLLKNTELTMAINASVYDLIFLYL